MIFQGKWLVIISSKCLFNVVPEIDDLKNSSFLRQLPFSHLYPIGQRSLTQGPALSGSFSLAEL